MVAELGCEPWPFGSRIDPCECLQSADLSRIHLARESAKCSQHASSSGRESRVRHRGLPQNLFWKRKLVNGIACAGRNVLNGNELLIGTQKTRIAIKILNKSTINSRKNKKL